MNYFVLNLGLALAWAALTGEFSPANLLIGFGLGYLILLAARRALGPSSYFGKVRQAMGFALFFLWELLLANLRVAYDVLTPRHHMQPRVIAVPLDAQTDAEITALANLISLTPGTLSLDVSSDRRVLYIHVMYASDAEAVRREIKDGLEQRLLALVRGAETDNE
ncbi:MAG: Na+/H+ antiporter subunit E [Chloroflexota bacterium]